MNSRIAVGRFGEDLVARRLTADGWEVLARNWRCPDGEIDLIAREGDCLVVIEVKTRRSVAFGSPLEAITPRKAARLRKLTALWLRASGERAGTVRIDAVGVVIPARGAPVLDHQRGVA